MYTDKRAEVIDNVLEALFMIVLIAFVVAYTIYA